MNIIQSWGPLLVTIGAMYGLIEIAGRGSPFFRGLAALATIALAIRYLWWRYAMSLPEPAEQNLMQQTWTWLFLLSETMTGMTSISMIAWMSRRRHSFPGSGPLPGIAAACGTRRCVHRHLQRAVRYPGADHRLRDLHRSSRSAGVGAG